MTFPRRAYRHRTTSRGCEWTLDRPTRQDNKNKTSYETLYIARLAAAAAVCIVLLMIGLFTASANKRYSAGLSLHVCRHPPAPNSTVDDGKIKMKMYTYEEILSPFLCIYRRAILYNALASSHFFFRVLRQYFQSTIIVATPTPPQKKKKGKWECQSLSRTIVTAAPRKATPRSIFFKIPSTDKCAAHRRGIHASIVIKLTHIHSLAERSLHFDPIVASNRLFHYRPLSRVDAIWLIYSRLIRTTLLGQRRRHFSTIFYLLKGNMGFQAVAGSIIHAGTRKCWLQLFQ